MLPEKIKICFQLVWWISYGRSRGQPDGQHPCCPQVDHRPPTTYPPLINLNFSNNFFNIFYHPITGSYSYFRLIYGLEYSCPRTAIASD